MARNDLLGMFPDTPEQKRLKKWFALKPNYRARLQRNGITEAMYVQGRTASLSAKARGHGSRERENAMAGLRKYRQKGYKVRTDLLNVIAETYGTKGQPDYKMAKLVITAQALAEWEQDNESGSHVGRDALRTLWQRRPLGSDDTWYWYH